MVTEAIKQVLVSKAELHRKVQEMGREITADYRGKDLVLIGILQGGAVFMADLMREIAFPVETDYMSVSSYGSGSQTSGEITVKKDTDVDVVGKDVLIVEDLVESGFTLKFLRELFLARQARSVKICTILDKPSGRRVEVHVDYKGIEIPDEFVVGYGLDYAGKYRNLPEVCALDASVLAK